MTVEELEKQELKPIYILYGPEKFILEGFLKKTKNRFNPIMKGINYILLEEEGVQNLISNIETPAFGFDKKLIIVKNSGLFKKENKKTSSKNPKIKEEFYSYIKENIIENNFSETENILLTFSNVIVFIEDEIEMTEIVKIVEKIGIVFNFKEQDAKDIIAKLRRIVKSYGVEISDTNLSYFISICGTNMQELINEIRKLIEYAGNQGKIEKKHIDMLCTKKIDAVIFDLTDNLGKKDIKKSLQILEDLKANKEPVQKIIITLYNHFRKLYIVKLCQKYNENIALNLKLKSNQMFLVNKYVVQTKYFSEVDLRNILKELTLLDLNYKSGKIDVEVGLDAVLCGYF